MGKFKNLFKDYRIIILIVALLLSVLAISPSFDMTDRLAIRNVIRDSAADEAGMEPPAQESLPRQRDILLRIDDDEIHGMDDYYEVFNRLSPNQSISVATRDARVPYTLTTRPEINDTIVDYETRIVNETNQTTNETYEVEEEVPIEDGTVLGVEDLGLVLYDAPRSNIRLGLDLEGGVRVMLEPEEPVTQDEMDIIISSLNQRLNVYGLSDVMIRDATDLEGNQFIIVEIPGADEQEVRSLIGEQGRFEARIGDDVAFTGGDDVRYVCRTAECSGLDPQSPCTQTEGGQWSCAFRFSITLSNEAAQRQADLTSGLDVVTENGQQFLSEELSLYLDDELVDSLRIGAELQGRASTDISISGSGTGRNREVAAEDAIESMRQLQTYLITGSLPVGLDFVKTDSVSPRLGAEFVENALFVGLLALLTVGVIMFLRYRRAKIVLPAIIAMLSQVLIILGVTAVMRWSLDLAAIAGIIIAAGTGVDHLIVVTDSVLRGGAKGSKEISWKEKAKNAFSIIFTAYLTTIAAMVFLFAVGAGLLRGFALTTILGISVGVLIARPAYSIAIKTLLDE